MQVHSEPDVKFSTVGNLHVESGRLICGDVDVAKRIAALAGIIEGGRQLGVIEVKFTKVTLEQVTSDPTEGGAFAEGSEP
jgi:hypothetical protein